ncbi:MAG: amidohydrolase family protein [Acidimicrobiales bacterium]|nr:amidohydrolase family protein [Acidimicrobiales bacterium]
MELDRFEWLALRQERAIDPDRVIVDPHHHLWDRGGSTYLAPQLLDDITGTHNVVKTIFVECRANYDKERSEHFWPIGETTFAAREADQTDTGGGPILAGIIGHADMMLGRGIADVLVAHIDASGGRFRGIRYTTAWDASGDIRNGHRKVTPLMMAASEFRSAARTLASMGLSFDAWLYHPQLPEVATLATTVPDLVIVLNHLGGPLAVGPYGRIRSKAHAAWRAGMRRVADSPNVFLKLGGVGMDDYFATGWSTRQAPPSSSEVADYWADDLRFCIDLFGSERCMFESNFPVDRQTLSYPVIWNSFQIIAADYTDAEQDDLFSGTATRVYRIS